MADDSNCFAGKVQRLNYSLGQYLEAEDFQAEQRYHVCMRRMGNKVRYSAGVLDGGFEVAKKADKIIQIGAGVAVDGEGRELVILAPVEKELAGLQALKTYSVVIAYDEKEDNPETSDDNVEIKTRFTELPEIKIIADGESIDREKEILLAKFALNANGVIFSGSVSPARQDAKAILHGDVGIGATLTVQDKIGIGMTNPRAQLHIAAGPDAALGAPGRGMLILGDVNTQHLVLDSNEIMAKEDGAKAGTLHLQGEGGLTNLGGSLSVNENMSLGAALNVKGKASFDTDLIVNKKIGIGTDSPVAQLHIAGVKDVRLNSSGSGMLILGDENKEHLAIDNNEIMVKANGTTAGKLHLQTDGGMTYLGGDLSVKEKIGIGTQEPKAQLHIATGPDVVLGVEGSGMLILGKENGPHLAFDDNEIMAKANGTTAGKLHLQNEGGATFLGGDLEFKRIKRQMINLWSESYGIGIQSSAQYYRTADSFAWFKGGKHHDSKFNPGANGNRLMGLNGSGDLILSARTNPTGASAKSQCRALVDYDDLLIINFGKDFSKGVQTSGDFKVLGIARKPGGGSWANTSDKKLKKNIKPIQEAYQKLLKLRGVNFEWKEPEKQGELTGVQMGLIAQEVEKVFPEWVSTDADGYKELSIRGFEGLVIEAFRALSQQVEQLQTKIKAIEKG